VWTATSPLAGGDLPVKGLGPFADIQLQRDFPWLPEPLRHALARRHGSYAYRVLKNAKSLSDLGSHFGADLYAREVDYMVEREWAQSGDDILYRRTKAGLHLTAPARSAVAEYVAAHAA
jgi:glycerol-3-phosphate dehydrogenase